jgi:hypothetical protein
MDGQIKVGNILLEDTYHGEEWLATIIDTNTNQICSGFHAEHIQVKDRPPEMVELVRKSVEKLNEATVPT